MSKEIEETEKSPIPTENNPKVPKTSDVMNQEESFQDKEEPETFTSQDNSETFPLNLGVIKLISLGRVEHTKKGYHNERYIFPIGYKSERLYNSYNDPNVKVPYICEILEDKDSEGPLFKVTCTETSEEFTANTPTGSWTPIIKKVQVSKKGPSVKRQHTTVSGPEYFGLSHPKCLQLIANLPNAEKCEKFIKSVKKEEKVKKITSPVAKVVEEKVEESVEHKMKTRSNKKKVEKEEKPKKKKQTKLVSQESTAIYPGLNTDKPFEPLQLHQYRYLSQNIETFDGYEPYATKFKQESDTKLKIFVEPHLTKQDIEIKVKDLNKEIESIRNLWEFAYVAYCINSFRSILKFLDCSIQEFENSIIKPEEHNGLLCDLHIKLLKGPALDKRAQELIDPNSFLWITLVQQKLDGIECKIWDYNPLKKEKYHQLSSVNRVMILKALFDWKIYYNQNQRVSEHFHKLNENVRIDPLGFDKEGNTYWYFGDQIGRIFKESSYKKGQEKLWITKTITLTDYKKFMETLEESLDPSEERLYGVISSFLPSLEKYTEEEIEREKKREEERIAEKKRAEELEKQKEIERIRYQKELEEKKKRDAEMDQLKQIQQIKALQYQGTQKMMVTRQQISQQSTPPPKIEPQNFEESRTRSGRAIRRKTYAEIKVEEQTKQEPFIDDDSDEESRGKKKKKQNDDDEFTIEEEDDEDDNLSDADEEYEELPEIVEEDEDWNDYGKKKGKVNLKVNNKTKPSNTNLQTKITFPSPNKIALPSSQPKLQPIKYQTPPIGGTPQKINPQVTQIQQPLFQHYYDNYMKMFMGNNSKTTTPQKPSVTTPNQIYPPNQFIQQPFIQQNQYIPPQQQQYIPSPQQNKIPSQQQQYNPSQQNYYPPQQIYYTQQNQYVPNPYMSQQQQVLQRNIYPPQFQNNFVNQSQQFYQTQTYPKQQQTIQQPQQDIGSLLNLNSSLDQDEIETSLDKVLSKDFE